MSCGFLSGPASGDVVQNQFSSVMNYAAGTYDVTITALNELKQQFSNTFGPTNHPIADGSTVITRIDSIPDFTKPAEPADLTLTFTAPASPVDPPSLEDVPTVSAGAVPTFTAAAPTYSLPAQPAALTATPPADPADLVVPDYPDAPTLVLPTEPTLRDITLPTLDPPDLSGIDAWLAELKANAPEAPGVFLDDNFLATLDQQYTLLGGRLNTFLGACPAFASLQTALTEQLSGNSIGVSTAVATLMRDRAFGAEDEQATRAEQTVLSDWLARGFELPNGALDARVQVIRQQNRDKKAALNRDLWIEEAKLEIQALQFALQQGIAYEGMYRDSWFKLYDLSRTIAAQVFEIQLKILEARIEVFKASITKWQAEADLAKTSLQAELAKLEVYRGELEAAKLVGELNRIDVEVFRGLLEAVTVQVNVYKTEVEAANARLQGELARIQAYGEMVRAYTARVGAYEAEWKGYSAAVQGELGKVEIYKALAQAFGIRVDAYAKQIDAEKAAGGFQVDVMRLRLEAWAQKMRKFEAELGAEVARVGSTAQVYDSKVKAFGVKVQAEDAFVGSFVREASLELERYKTEVQILLKNAELELQKVLETAKTTMMAFDGIARTGAQLTTGAWSACNVGAEIRTSTSYSNSSDCSTTYSYQY